MTKHSEDCNRVFKNYDDTCPRCKELMAGAKPRSSWKKNFQIEQQLKIAEIRKHDCKVSRCGPVCTFGDW